MSNNISFQVHTSDNNISTYNTPNTNIPISNTYTPTYNAYTNTITPNTNNNFSFFPLFMLLSITNLENISMDPENRSNLIQRLFRENDDELTRDPNKKLQLNTQFFNTTDMKFDECSICTECFEAEDQVSVLECSHIYHTHCIQEWGYYNASCPICKNNIPLEEKNDDFGID